jgi:hypothetical protein
MIRVAAMALSLVVMALVACRAPPPTRAELLQRLQKCRDELPKVQPTERFVSPCAKLDPLPLNGISRSELATVLGPPTFCTGLSEGGVPQGADCPPQLNPKWSFHLTGGVGPELACETDDRQRCEVVRWISSE